MAKTSGLGSSLIVGVYDISGDIGALSSIETMRSALEVPDITQSAMARIVALRDGTLGYSSYWNTVAGQAHAVLSPQARTDLQMTYFHGATVGNPAASLIAKQVNYAPARGQDGSLVAETIGHGNGYPLEWGELLTAGKETFGTGTVNGTSIDLGDTETLFGAAAYLHVISVASGTATFKIQDSDNDTDFDDVTGMTFTNATGATTERKQGAVDATLRQYVRLQGSGVHGAAVVVCNLVRYTESPA